jgi:hypothetical protein
VVISSILNRFELPAFEGAIVLYGRIRSDAGAELPHTRAAANWAARLP